MTQDEEIEHLREENRRLRHQLEKALELLAAAQSQTAGASSRLPDSEPQASVTADTQAEATASASTASTTPPLPARALTAPGSSALATWLTLLFILLLAAYFRGTGLLTWDEHFRLHPDERFLSSVAASVKIPASWGEYFDSATSPLNPRNIGEGKTFFVYGLLPVSMTRLIAEQLGLTGYDAIFKVGRVLSTLFDLGSVVLVFLLGLRIAGRRVGLLAALLAALAVLPIQLSHFFTVDTFASFFVLLSLYWALRIAQGCGWGCYAALGVSTGLATAGGRVTFATLGLVGVVAAIQASNLRQNGIGPFLRRALPLLALSGALALLTFRVLEPDAFIGSRLGSPSIEGAGPSRLEGLGFFDIRPDPRYIQDLQEQRGLASGAIDLPTQVQWAGQADYIVPLRNMVLWGMGAPLGVLALAGWAAAGWQILQRRWSTPLVLWVWTSFYFAWQGALFTKYMRYLLPIYGPLILFGAWALVALWERGTRRDEGRAAVEGRHRWREVSGRWAPVVGRWAPAVGRLLIVVAVLGTACWAYAFTRIYTRPHTRIAASRWLFENAPPGSRITSEAWDDALPLHVDGRNPWEIFEGIMTAPFAEDELAKYTGYRDTAKNEPSQPGLLDQLDAADFVVLSSNRVYDSIVRLPMRYPALIRYYHYLFNGELGFELVADFTSYPTLFGISIPDQSADESFSVYDHPRVLIFRKTEAFSRERAEQLLTAGILWPEVYKVLSSVGDQAPTALRFTPTQWDTYRQSGTWAALFNPNSLSRHLPALVWLLVVEVVGLSVFALLFHLLPMLPDRGFSLAKAIALLLVAYSPWLLGSLEAGRGAPWLAFSPLSVWACTAALIAVGALLAWRSRTALGVFWRQRRAALVTAEGLFLLAFCALLVVRSLNPDLWHPSRGGEKAMDLAYLTATVKSAAFPPYDPWFAGGHVNYYYFGFVIVGALIHLTGITPAVAYNLAVPTLFALTALGSWGIVYNLLSPRRQHSRVRIRAERSAILAGLLAVLLVLMVGNLAQAIWFLPGSAGEPTTAWSGSYATQQIAKGRSEWAFWDATRIVDGTINEFPFFTFLFADLHAHMIVMPFSLAALGLMVALARNVNRRGLGAEWPVLPRSALAVLFLLAFVTGSLRAINTWDYPTFTGLAIVTLALVERERVRRGLLESSRALRMWAGQAALVVVLGVLFFRPFDSSFVTESAGVEIWQGPGMMVWDWLRIYGLWLFILVSAGVLLARRRLNVPARILGVVLSGLLVVVVVGVWAELPAARLLLVLAVLTLYVAWAARQQPVRVLLPLLWASTGLALSLMVEFVVVRGDVGRMNTVFKFGLHTWILFALAAAVALPWLWIEARRWPAWGKYGWLAGAVLAVGAGLVYPLTATPARIADHVGRDRTPSLDGMAYMEYLSIHEGDQTFSLEPDANAITWIQQNITGSPVMLEAHLPSYRWAGRIATYTGLPTLLGWEWHQVQQRRAVRVEPVVEARKAAISQIYSSPDPDTASNLMRDYGVEYLYAGELERALYGSTGLAKFDTMVRQGQLERVYDREGTRIYRVLDTNFAGILTTDLAIVKPRLPEVSVLPEASSSPYPNPTAESSFTDEEVIALEARLAAVPEDAEAAYALAQAYHERNRIDDGILALTAAVEAHPRHVELQLLLGDLLNAAGRYDEAEAAYFEAIVADPSASNFNRLGAAQLAWGRLEDAQQNLSEATSIDPNLPDPHYWLGVIFVRQGEDEQARASLERYLQLAPDGSWRSDALRLLQKLK